MFVVYVIQVLLRATRWDFDNQPSYYGALINSTTLSQLASSKCLNDYENGQVANCQGSKNKSTGNNNDNKVTP